MNNIDVQNLFNEDISPDIDGMQLVDIDFDGIEESAYYCMRKAEKAAFVDADMKEKIEEHRKEIVEE